MGQGTCDIIGNNIADKAANEAHSNNMSTFFQLSFQEKTNILKSSIFDFWQCYRYAAVADTNKGKHLRDLRYPDFISLSTSVVLNNRRDEVNIYRLRIGHAGLSEHLFKTGQSDSNLCNCGKVETIEHYLLYCQLHDNQRQILYRDILSIIKPFPRVTVKLLLGLGNYSSDTNIRIMKVLCKYIRSTGKSKVI